MVKSKDHKTVMNKDEMYKYIESIGRAELFDELKDLANKNYRLISNGASYSRYLKAIRVSLVAQGYDEQWVEHEFRDALEERYLKRRHTN